MLDFLIAFFTDYGYIAVFGILILCGFGLPVPEDITLVSGGVIAGLDLANPHTMVIVGLAGVLIGDSTMFIAGRVFGYRIQRIRTFRKILSPRRFSHIQRKFKQYGLSLLFIARFLPGLRSPIFLVAGMSRRIPYLTFVLMDGFAALISVPVWVYLGYFFADNLDLLMEYVKDVQTMIYIALFLVVAVVVIIYLKKRFHSKMSKFSDESQCNCEPTTPITREQAATIVKGEPLCECEDEKDKSSASANSSSQASTNQDAKSSTANSTTNASAANAELDTADCGCQGKKPKVETDFATVGKPEPVQINKKPHKD